MGKYFKKIADEEDNEYDPFVERKTEHPTTNWDTFIHLLKGSLGTGILAMPNASKDAGYIVAPISTLIIGLICIYAVHMLVRCEYVLCKRAKVPKMSYPETAAAALKEGPECMQSWSNAAKHLVNIFLFIYQFGICCIYNIFVAKNIESIIDFYTGKSIDVRLMMLYILIPLILFNWVRNLKYLSPFSAFGNLLTLVCFGIVAYYIFSGPISTTDKFAAGDIKQFPLFFGTVLFALEAIGVIFPLENEMKTPRSFQAPCGVYNNGMAIIIFLYAAMGLFGYLRYGSDIEDSITLNLPQDEGLAHSVKIMFAFAVFVSHGLNCFVAFEILWKNYILKHIENSPNLLLWDYIFRTFIVIMTFLFAVAIPKLGLFISLVGALCISCVGIAFPAIIEFCTYWKYVDGLPFRLMVAKQIFFIIIGLAGFIIGTYTSIYDIVMAYKN